MSVPETPSNELLARVLAGEGTQPEAELVELWAASAPEHRAELERLSSAMKLTRGNGDWDVDRAWQQAEATINDGDSSTDVIPIPQGRVWPAVVLRIAAAALVVVGLSWAWQVAKQVDGVSYATGDGERLEVVLPDGSLAVLAPRSSLDVPGDYGSDDRKVQLTGEAWFSVEHDIRSEFQVSAGVFKVTDLGTVFTVDATVDNGLSVAVVEGAVMVQDSTGQLSDQSLLAGEVGSFGQLAAEGVAVERGQELEKSTAWHTGLLEVEDTPFYLVAERLLRWYGVAITIEDSTLNGRAITASLSLDSLDDALEVLGLLLDAEVVRDSFGIVFR